MAHALVAERGGQRTYGGRDCVAATSRAHDGVIAFEGFVNPVGETSPLPTRWATWLDRPQSQFTSVLGWAAATIVFVGIVTFLGGPNLGDASQSFYSTWAVAHGNLACAYSSTPRLQFSPLFTPSQLIAPLYPLATGALAALFRIGHAATFPSSSQLGSHCSSAFVAYYHWALRSHVLMTTLRLGYVVWLVLMGGVVAVIRAAGRGRCHRETVVVLAVALLSPVYLCIVEFFHPQDVLAMGLILASVAGALSGRWVWSGIMVGLAIATQQYAFLALAPLFMVSSPNRRAAFAASATLAVAVIDIPMAILTSGRAIRPALFGSSRITFLDTKGLTSTGGTVLWELHLQGLLLFAITRALPIVAAAALGWWTWRRLGSAALEPAPLLSLIAASLCLRLVFEENLFGYYFMAISVALVVLDAARGRLRGSVVAWLALVTLAFNPVPEWVFLRWEHRGVDLYVIVPLLFMSTALVVVLYDALHHRVRWYLLAWVVVVVLTAFPQFYGRSLGASLLPMWDWQVILVPTAFALAIEPLATLVTGRQGLRVILRWRKAPG